MMTILDSSQQVQGLEGGHNRGTTNRGDRMLCVIRVGDYSLALRTSVVQEVIGSAVLVTVPLAPRFLAGVLNHRGVMLSIVSLCSVLGLPPGRVRTAWWSFVPIPQEASASVCW